MSESPLAIVQAPLEEFLDNWRYLGDQYYPLLDEESCASVTEGYCFRFSVGVNKYLEVVELYVITLLAMTLKETDLAISWVEKAMLPMEKRQKLLQECPLESQNTTNITDDAISIVFVKEARGRVRGMGFGVTPSKIRASVQSNGTVKQLQDMEQNLQQELQEMKQQNQQEM